MGLWVCQLSGLAKLADMTVKDVIVLAVIAAQTIALVGLAGTSAGTDGDYLSLPLAAEPSFPPLPPPLPENLTDLKSFRPSQLPVATSLHDLETMCEDVHILHREFAGSDHLLCAKPPRSSQSRDLLCNDGRHGHEFFALFCGNKRCWEMPDVTRVMVMIPNGFVTPGTCMGEVPGMPISTHCAITLSRWMSADCHADPPPDSILSLPIVRFPVLLSSPRSSYPGDNGHFLTQTLPRALYLLKHGPPDAPLLISRYGIVEKVLVELVRLGHITQDRIVAYDPQKVYLAQQLYYVDHTPYAKYADNEADLQLVRDVLRPKTQPEPRDILYVKRHGTRSLANEVEVLDAIRAQIAGTDRQLLVFEPAATLEHDIREWGRAMVVVAPHGAGLANTLWLHSSARVLELGYPGFWPDMFYHIATRLGHRYYYTMCAGSYGGSLTVPLEPFNATFKMALGGA